MALKRCVTIRAPAAKAAAASAAVASLWPRLTTAPASASAADLRRRRARRRQRHDQRRQPAGGVDEEREVRRLHRPDQPRVVRALAAGVEVRPLEVQPEEAGHALGGGGDPRLHRRAGDLGRVGDQRRQEPGRPEPRMRGADGADAVEVGVVVQHHPAAAVHLQVDEPRRQHPAAEPHPRAGGRLVRRHDRRHAAVLDQERGSRVQPRPVEDRGAFEDRRHSVSVTLRRWGGVSGLNPRRRASASMKR